MMVLHIGHGTNASVSLMYTVALTVDTLVGVDTPESTLINTEVKKKLINGVCISMGLQFSMEIVLFYVINPLAQQSKKPCYNLMQ